MATTKNIPVPLSMEFESLSAARNAIRAFVIAQGESYVISHSDRTRYIVICRDTFCKFRI
jgi:MuDR family transposase